MAVELLTWHTNHQQHHHKEARDMPKGRRRGGKAMEKAACPISGDTKR